MNQDVYEKYHRYIVKRNRRAAWQKIVSIMACFVVFFTTYILILPAITMEQKTFCGLDEHTHSEPCYQPEGERQLICSPEDHIHDETCWLLTDTLVCDQMDTTSHTDHSEECFDESGVLICEAPETHVHQENCYEKEQICAGHIHENSCYEEVSAILCNLETHTHGLACYSDPSADVETAAEWEATFAEVTLAGNWRKDALAIAKSQLGYKESEKNYMVGEDDATSGYTRYGAWYGDPYGAWNAMYLSFCLDYAGVEGMPLASSVPGWIEDLKILKFYHDTESHDASVGDLIFFDRNGDALADHVGFVSEIIPATSTAPIQLQVIEGDISDCVQYATYDAADSRILGYGELPAQPMNQEDIDETEAIDEEQSLLDTSSDEFAVFSVSRENELITADTGSSSGNVLTMKVINSNTLKANSKYIIYAKNNNKIVFLNANANGSTASCTTASLTSFSGDAFSANAIWTTTDNSILSANGNNFGYLWTVVFENNNLRLKSRYGHYLAVKDGTGSTQKDPFTLSVINSDSNTSTKKLSNLKISNSTSLYIAEVTYEVQYPDCVKTGDVSLSLHRFYNLYEKDGQKLDVLPGCVFEIVAVDANNEPLPNVYCEQVTSGNDITVLLPPNLPNGNYRITEISVPEGYVSDVDPVRYFNINGGHIAFYGQNSSSLFTNHQDTLIVSDKIAGVEDYNNRTYQIMMSAQTNIHNYSMNPIDVLFVVDQSNSMLFPSAMDPVPVAGSSNSYATVTISKNNCKDNIQQLEALRANGTLKEGTLYYIIADPAGSATAWALWYDGYTWMTQDASYYAKAKMGNIDGYKQPGETAIFPKSGAPFSTDSIKIDDTNKEKANGGDLSYSPQGSLGNHLGNNNNQYTYQIYTAKEEHNRLHYLEQAIATSIYQLHAINPKNAVAIIKFTKTVNETVDFTELSEANLPLLIDKVNKINTLGGTRQDRALEAAKTLLSNRNNSSTGKNRLKYTMLVTDGAPVKSGDDNMEVTDIYKAIVTNAEPVRNLSKLFTVALGMGEVKTGREKLEEIASYKNGNSGSKYCYAYDDSSNLIQAINELVLINLTKAESVYDANATVVDTISNSFYPIAWSQHTIADRKLLYSSNSKNWYMLQIGDWISLEGEYYGPSKPVDIGRYGQLCSNDGNLYIQWHEQNGLESSSGWNATFYVKAKEDFIGGNAIYTNQEAYITIGNSAKHYNQPTVNVRLLEMNEFSSEVTVFLGDMINGTSLFESPLDTLKDFYDRTSFAKLVSDEGNPTYRMLMNAANPADGLNADSFYIWYATNLLSDAETREAALDWLTLTGEKTNGKSPEVRVPYTYDGPSSQGLPVGYFTFTLEKEGSEHYDSHKATTACESQGVSCAAPAERYTLKINYSAYKLGEFERPGENAHNGDLSPGTEVGSNNAGKTVETGLGLLEHRNVHDVHVISGKITIVKEIEDTLLNPNDSQVYTFSVIREDLEDTTETVSVEILPGETTGSVTLSGLERGIYTITEDVNDHFRLQSMTIQETTNCESIKLDSSVRFHIGYDKLDGENVIAQAENEVYTSYLRSPNGVYGEVLVVNTAPVYYGEIPVRKVWDDGNVNHDDAVYLILYEVFDEGTENERQQLIMADTENAKIIRLDASNNWTGAFQIALTGKDDRISDHSYLIREVSIAEDGEIGVPAILENDGSMTIFKDPVAEGNTIIIGDIGYLVEYTTDEGFLVVINHLGRVLPESGSMGTQVYTISGVLILAGALTYGYILTKNIFKRKEVSE